MSPGDEPLLERELAGRSREPRPQAIVRRGQHTRLDPERLGEPQRDRRERLSASQRLGAHEVQAEVEVAELEPVFASERAHGLQRAPGLVGTPPAALLVVQPCERVQDRVEVRRDVQPEHLDVVADVPDHGDLSRLDGVDQSPDEPRAAHAAGEDDDPHTCTRSAGVSTSSRRPGPVDVGGMLDVRAEASGAARPVERREEARVREPERIRRAVAGRGDRDSPLRYRIVERAEVVGRQRGEVGVDDEHRPRADLLKRGLDCGPLSAAGIANPRRAVDRFRRDDPRLANARRHGQHVCEHRSRELRALRSEARLPARARVRNDDADHVRSGRTAIVTRLTAHSLPSSSVSSTSQTQVVRPR